MKITDVILTEEITKEIEFSAVKMSRLGDIVLLAGKNGSGKTRILNSIKNQAVNFAAIKNSKTEAKKQLEILQNRVKEQSTHRQQIEKGIAAHRAQIDIWQKQFELTKSHSLVSSIKSYENQIESWQKNIEQLPQQLERLLENIEQNKLILETPIPLILNEESQNVSVVDFVPNRIELEDWANHSKQEWTSRATNAKNVGVGNLFQSTIPLIQQVIEEWARTSNDNLGFDESTVKQCKDNYNRLQEIVNSFIGTTIGYSRDGYSTLFNKPIAQAQLSAGQKVLLQLCVAIYAQGASLANYIIFMDEPENHLHPSAVIDLLDSIKLQNPNGQIWIATHSIPLLSHYNTASIWFVENGVVRHSGKKPEQVLASLLGSEDRIQKLRDFTSLPSELARNRFAFECLCPPMTVETNSDDPQSNQLNEQLKVIWQNKESISLLDFGAGKGRMIANLSDYDNVSNKTLDYHAYDPNEADRECCIQNISLSYDNAIERYHSHIEDMRCKVGDSYFDVVVLSNVLHEIRHQEWCLTFSALQNLIKEDGYLLMIEDCLIPTGELPHINGFIVLNTLHLKKLFNIPSEMEEKNFIAHDARFDSKEQRGRLMAHLIPKKYLANANSITIKDALNELVTTATSEIRKIRTKEANYTNGLAHSFWIQQLANATLSLSEL
ncbi:MAG: AAA family ATPase [Campylobacterales bacterium]